MVIFLSFHSTINLVFGFESQVMIELNFQNVFQVQLS
jgi:hypothetical protein